MTSDYLKVALLHKFRFVHRYPYLATEVGAFSADVCTISNGRLMEFETKISMADFKADFKKPKHKIYLRGSPNTEEWTTMKNDWRYCWVPHQFSFVVPERMAEDAAAYLIQYPKYGLVVVKEVDKAWHLRDAPIFLKRPKKLHLRPISQKVYQQFLYRMGSELANNATLKLRGEYGEEVREKQSEQRYEQEVPDTEGSDASIV